MNTAQDDPDSGDCGESLPRSAARQEYSLTNLLIVGVPHLGLIFAPFYFSWSGLILMLAGWVILGLGITAGYHRLLTHRSYQTTSWVRNTLAFLAALSLDTVGPSEWVGSHRLHHKFSDHDGDPHSPRDGDFWSHVGWALRKNSPAWLNAARDMEREPFMHWLQRFHHALAVGFVVLLYVAGEAVGGLGLSWLLWGGCVRIVAVMHAEWLVNSATHRWGYQNFPTSDRSKNLWWVALLTLGEGWHNNHHAQPGSAAHGMKWWEMDPTWVFICTLERLGLAWDVRRPQPSSGVIQSSR
jgi:stearoyl-CoA desaturase (delta-9 desaturase)